MAVIGQRHGGYKAGLLLFLCGMVAFIVGFATPYWYTFTYSHVKSPFGLKGHGGLWVTCFKGLFGVYSCVDAAQSWYWEYVVKGLESVSLAFMVISLFFAIYTNFMVETVSCFRLLEVSLGIAGGLGLSGAVTYGTRLMQDEDFLSKRSVLAGYKFDFTLSWSFALAIAGSAVVIIAVVLISIFNRPLPQQQQQQQQQQPPASGFSHLVYAAPAGSPAPPPSHVNVYATPGIVAYSAPPPAYYAGLNVGQMQGVGQGQAMGQGQGQTSAPMMVFDTPPVGGQKQ